MLEFAPHTITFAKRDVLYAPIQPKRPDAPTALIVGAHPDDETMAEGVDDTLIAAGVNVIYVDLTLGEARNLPNYTPTTLAQQRWKESIAAIMGKGGKELYNAQIPDSNVSQHYETGVVVLNEIVTYIKPTIILAPHHGDPHPDHAATYAITREAAQTTPLYATDTITGKDKQGRLIRPTHYVALSKETNRKRNEGYLAHATQVVNLPTEQEDQEKDAVLAMTRRRGREIGVDYAGAVIFTSGSHDPLQQLLGNAL